MAGRGAGRGNLVEIIKKKMEEEKRLKEEAERARQMEELQQREQEEKLKEEAAAAPPAQVSATTSVGRGRGALLEKMRSKIIPGVDTSSPTPSTTASVTSIQTTSTSTIGRGALLSALKKRYLLYIQSIYNTAENIDFLCYFFFFFRTESASPIPSTTASVTSVQTTSTSSGGRGSLLSTLKKKYVMHYISTYLKLLKIQIFMLNFFFRTDSDTLETSGEQTGVVGKLSSLSLEDTKSSLTDQEIVSRQGSSGKT